MVIDFILIVAGLTLLVVGADRFVIGAANLARQLGMSPLIIGLTIVGIATSAPEALVGSVAALNGNTTLAVGNAIGSNIANIGLVLGATVLFRPMLVQSATLRREYIFMIASILLAAAILFDQHLGRTDGLILCVSLVIMMWLVVTLARRASLSDPLASEFSQEYEQPMSVGKSSLLFIIGLLLLLGGAEILVRGAVSIAQALGVSDLIIGLTIVAVGTSLPELAASISSVLKNEADIAIGNIIGSNMFNMLMVLGIPALIRPTAIGSDVMYRDYPIMLGLSLLMGWMVFISSRGKIARLEGGFLFLCFIAYQGLLFVSVSA